MQRAALAVSQASGQRVYETLIEEVAAILAVDEACVAVFTDIAKTRLRTLAVWRDGAACANFEYALVDAPWAASSGGESRFVADAPSNQAGTVRDSGLPRHASHPLVDSAGNPLGVLVVTKDGGLDDAVPAESILTIFSVRIAGEIERSRGEQALRRAAIAVSSAEGENVFHELVGALASILEVEIAFVALPGARDPATLKMLALQVDGHVVPDFEYPVANTPCEQVLRSGYRLFPDEVAERFPGNADLKMLGARSYAGVRLSAADGTALGIVSVASRKALPHADLVESMLRIFAARVRTEIERTRSQATLQLSEEQYRAIFNASADALVLWDSSLRRVDVNPAYERIHGYTRDEALRSDYRTGLPPEYAERRRALIRRTLAGERCELELETVRKDGQRIQVEVRTIPIVHRGQPHVLAIIRDVTERNRIAAEARASEEQYRGIFNASLDGMALWDELHRLVDVNPALLAMRAFGREDLGKAGFGAFIASEGRDECRRMLESALAGERAQGEVALHHPGGVLRNIEIRAVPLRYHGRPHALWLVRDVTERKNADAALRTSEAQYRAIFNAWTDALVLRDESFRIVDVNATYERFTGRTRAEVIGVDHVIANPPGVDERVKAMHGRVLKGEHIHLETQLLHLDGSHIELELRGVPIWHQGKPHVLYVGRDVTARKQADVERMALEAQLRQAQKMEAIGQLTGGIAHDFNNILQSVLGYIVLAEERQELLNDGPLRRYLEQMDLAAQRASSLVRQMLTFSRGHGGERKAVPLAPLVLESSRMLRSTLPATITLHAAADPHTATALLDPVQFEQVVLNLVINARDAMQGTGAILVATANAEIAEAVCASCRQRLSGAFVELSVRDSGPGIPDDVAERMFEPFFTTKEVGKGSGMGLAMVHGIVHNHGGHVLVETAQGVGTTMRVLFPRMESAVEPSAAVETPSVRRAKMPRLHGRVLVADDEPAIRELLCELLTGWGLDLIAEATGVDAAAAFRRDPGGFDLVLTDHTMPGMTGVELAREITSRRPGLPVLLSTGFAEDLDEQLLAAAGVSELVRKPFEPAQLQAILARLLGRVPDAAATPAG